MKKKIVFLSPKLEKNTGGYFRVKDNLDFLKEHFEVEEIWIKSRKDFKNIIDYINYLNRIKKKINKKIVFIEFPKYVFIIPFSSKLIYSAHNFETELRFSFFKKEKTFKNFVSFLIWSVTEFIALYRSNLIITITEKLRYQLKKLTYKNIMTLFPRISKRIVDDFKFSELENSYYFIGSFNWFPNLEAYNYFINNLLPYFSMKYNKNIKFYFIGKNNDKYKDFQLKRTEIIHLGFIDNLEKIISRCKGTIIPIISGSGLKIKFLESLMYNKIPVTTLKGIEGLEEYKDNFLVFNNEEEFLKKIELLDDKYNFEIYEKKLNKVFDKLKETRNNQEKFFLSLMEKL